MAGGITTAFWSMTINNPDETDLALVKANYPDHVREIRYTMEVGENGTPHIQAYIKLQRQQRLSFVKKLFPRGHFKPLTSDVYIYHTKEYVLKDDSTTRGKHVITFNDPIKTIENVIFKVINRMFEEYDDEPELSVARHKAERDLVLEDYKFAKIFVSSTYKQMWRDYGHDMYECVFQTLVKRYESERAHTHTHTHTDEIFSQEVNIPTTDAPQRNTARGGDDSQTDSDEVSRDSDGEDNEDGATEADEGYSEGSGDDASEETGFTE